MFVQISDPLDGKHIELHIYLIGVGETCGMFHDEI